VYVEIIVITEDVEIGFPPLADTQALPPAILTAILAIIRRRNYLPFKAEETQFQHLPYLYIYRAIYVPNRQIIA
jgi:hypothetical protein